MDGNQPKKRFQFDEFVLSERAGTLSVSGEPVPVEPKVMAFLHYLVSHCGSLATKEELVRELYGAETVEGYDESLHRLAKIARRILGDDAEFPRYIHTVTRRGYRFEPPDDMTVEDEPEDRWGIWSRPSGSDPGSGGDRLSGVLRGEPHREIGIQSATRPRHDISDDTLLALIRGTDVVARKALATFIGRYADEFSKRAAAYENPKKLFAIAFMAINEDCDKFDFFAGSATEWIRDKLGAVLQAHGTPLVDGNREMQPRGEEPSTRVLEAALESLSESDQEAIRAPGTGDPSAIERYCTVVRRVFAEMREELSAEGPAT